MDRRELANSSMNAAGHIIKAGEDMEKERILSKVILSRYAENHRTRLCHIHDLEYFDITYNCVGVTAADLIGEKDMSFSGAIRALYRGIAVLTNAQSGGIGFLNFDRDMERYVMNETPEELSEIMHEFFCDLNVFVRKGCEKAYVTLNFGLAVSEKGKLVSGALLDAYERGDETGRPFTFPNLVFKLKKSVNVEEKAPNHDVFLKALTTTSKRMVPTYFNCDSVANRAADPEKIGIMGCRTRVVDNLYGEKSGLNRGNIACVTLNLVQMALESGGDAEIFQARIAKEMESARELLELRYRTLVENGDFSEFFRLGVYKDSESGDVEKALMNGTLSIGFIGLWDALSVIHETEWQGVPQMSLYGEEALGIIKMMRGLTDSFIEETGHNYSLLASAAEGVTGSFAHYDSLHAGKGKYISEKGYYSNSFHVPVNIRTDFMEKIELEGQFHRYCNGGAITYVELEEMPLGNTEAVKEIVEYAYHCDCNYFGINFPLDNCNDCGYLGGIADRCPKCNGLHIRRLRRVSGYLAEEDRFVAGKALELSDRTAHVEKIKLRRFQEKA